MSSRDGPRADRTPVLNFAAAVFFLLITPGPGVLSTAGVGAAFGPAAGARYVAGLFVGTNLVALAVISGLAAIVLADPRIRTVLFVASACYLLYLALRIAFAGARVAFIEAARPPGFWGGVALQWINPKAYAVNTALLTGFSFWPEALGAELFVKLLILNGIWIPIHFIWLYAGIWLNELNLSGPVQRGVNMGMAASMLVVVALAVAAQFA